MKSTSILQTKSSMWIASAILFAIIIIGLGLINKLSSIEHERDVQNWQYRLSLMADVRENLLNNWLNSQYETLNGLAKNQSLQLYLSQIQQTTNNTNSDIQTAQRIYLRNLLYKTARDNDFFEESPANVVKASIPIIKHSGIAIFNADGKAIVATPNMPPLDKISIEGMKEVAKSGVKRIRDVYLNEHNEQVITFMVPVSSIIDNNTSKKPIATIIGVRTLKKDLYHVLDKDIFSTDTDASVIVRRNLGAVTYLNKNKSGDNVLMNLPGDATKLAAAFAVKNPGAFSIRKNYLGTDVLFISRAIPETNWLMLQMISSKEALKDSASHRQSLITSSLFGLAALIFIIIAAWRHGASLYSKEYANLLTEKSLSLTQQRNVLQSVTDSVNDLILIVDKDSYVQFSNMPVANLHKLTPEDITGKMLTAVFGNETGKSIEHNVIKSRASQKAILSVQEFFFKNSLQTYHCSFLPIENDSTLIVLHDITQLKTAQDKNKKLLKNLVHTLTHVIDSYVPNSANHSEETTKIAYAIGKEIELTDSDLETLELAACIANIGKLFIPQNILLKTTELTSEEQTIVQETLNKTTELLTDLDFDGPVLETIAQKNEKQDGSGYPDGLSGENILITARILAVANAFVAMNSPRPYREAIPTNDILHQLFEDSGKLYDKRVVAALIHVIENKL